MSYLDRIIKYLSGELSREESRAFEKDLESNAELKAAFEEHSAAYRLVQNQLQKRDEDAFQSKLVEAMSLNSQGHNSRTRALKSWWYIPPAVACVLAIFLIFIPAQPENETLFSRYYHPAKDPLVLAYYQDTRGRNEPGIRHYRQGNHKVAMDLLSKRFNEEQDNKMILLYYLLSSMELDRQGEVLELVSSEDSIGPDLVDQSISWYLSLALTKSDRREEALNLLRSLVQQEGPYHSDASKLEKLLLK